MEFYYKKKNPRTNTYWVFNSETGEKTRILAVNARFLEKKGEKFREIPRKFTSTPSPENHRKMKKTGKAVPIKVSEKNKVLSVPKAKKKDFLELEE